MNTKVLYNSYNFYAMNFLIIILNMSTLMLYLLRSHFASNQRLLNSLPLLMLDAYPLQVVGKHILYHILCWTIHQRYLLVL